MEYLDLLIKLSLYKDKSKNNEPLLRERSFENICGGP